MDPKQGELPNGACPRCNSRRVGAELEGLCPVCVAAMAFARPNTGEGVRRFGNYELLEEIARGGMGVVFKARQVGLNRTVAVKMITSGQFASAGQVQRFRAEAEAVAALQHPHIVAIHEVGECEGRCFFSMEYVEGENLATLVRERPLSPARAAACVEAIAEAIHYAHQRGTLHRDLKPSNVVVDPFGQPRIIDFGLAKRLDQNLELTASGQMIGTPSFMPPEQAAAKNGAVGPRSDVYSLGAILYFLLTGRPPFAGRSLEATIAQVLNEEPVRPGKFAAGVPPDLETVCLKCLEKDSSRRYSSALELAEDLGRFLRGEPVAARLAGRAERMWRWSRRHPAVASLGISLAITLAALAIVLAFMTRPAGFQRLAPVPVRSACGASGVIEGRIYRTSPCDGYSGRRNHLHAYDAVQNVWSRALKASPVIHSESAAGVLNGRFFLAGGLDDSGLLVRADAYDPGTDRWQQVAPLPVPLMYCASAVWDGKLFVLGGTDGTNALNAVHVYDPAGDRWTAGPPLPTPRVSVGAIALGRSLFIVGGVTAPSEGTMIEAVEALQPDGVWRRMAPLPLPVAAPAVAAFDGVLYVAGGLSATGAVAALQAYRPDSDQWAFLAPMPEARQGGHSAQAVNGKLYIIGGWSGATALPCDDVFAYNPRRNVWRR